VEGETVSHFGKPPGKGKPGKAVLKCTILVQKLSSTYEHENIAVIGRTLSLETLESPLYMQNFPSSSMKAAGKLFGFELSSLKKVVAIKRLTVNSLSNQLSSLQEHLAHSNSRPALPRERRRSSIDHGKIDRCVDANRVPNPTILLCTCLITRLFPEHSRSTVARSVTPNDEVDE
jgi:hypothetical protein